MLHSHTHIKDLSLGLSIVVNMCRRWRIVRQHESNHHQAVMLDVRWRPPRRQQVTKHPPVANRLTTSPRAKSLVHQGDSVWRPATRAEDRRDRAAGVFHVGLLMLKQRRLKLGDVLIQTIITGPLAVNGLDCVHHGGVITPTEVSAYLTKAEPRVLSGEVHPDLPRQ